MNAELAADPRVVDGDRVGCESRAIARASRRNRARIWGSKALPETISFSARGASSSRCRTSQTVPIPPSPIWCFDLVAVEEDLAGPGWAVKARPGRSRRRVGSGRGIAVGLDGGRLQPRRVIAQAGLVVCSPGRPRPSGRGSLGSIRHPGVHVGPIGHRRSPGRSPGEPGRERTRRSGPRSTGAAPPRRAARGPWSRGRTG